MIDFTTVTREFRGLVDRRREVFMFLGSGFVAMSLFFTNALEGKFPPALAALQTHVFSFYALALMVLSLLLALRMARLHGGMVLNGVLYARCMQEQEFTRKGDPARSARHNPVGVSFIQFLLVNLLAGFSTFILLVAVAVPEAPAAGAGLVIFASWLMLYFRFHHKAADFALAKAAAEPVGPVREEDWREHVSLSLQQANHGLLAEIAFAGLMVFSGMGTLSGLGKIEVATMELGADAVRNQGPLFFAGVMVAACLFELVIYLRVRLAIGHFSLHLDPTDRPFRAGQLTDSLLGYMLLAFLLSLSLDVFLTIALSRAGLPQPTLLIAGVAAAAWLLAVAAEQLTLVRAGRLTVASTTRPGSPPSPA